MEQIFPKYAPFLPYTNTMEYIERKGYYGNL